MRWTVGTKIGIGFGLTLAIFVVVGVVSYRGTTQLIEASDWSKHTYEVLTKISGAISLLEGAETAQRGYLVTGDEAYLEPYQEALRKVDPGIDEIRKLTQDNPRQQHRLDMFESLVRNRLAISNETIGVRRTQGIDATIQLLRTGKGKTVMDEMRKLIAQMLNEEEDLLRQREDQARTDASRAKATILFGTLIALVFAALVAVSITRNIAGPLQHLTRAAEKITAGDLAVDLPAVDRSDEVGVLARTFARMVEYLRQMSDAAERIATGDLRSAAKPQSPNDLLGHAFAKMTENLREQTRSLVDGANVLGAAASEIVATTTQLAASASESAAAVGETTTTVEEVRQTAQVASQKARDVSESAQKAAQISQSGRKSTEAVEIGISRIRLQMEAIAASMLRLSEQSQSIGQIMATVEDLAAQSTLLAVNAAIEAARAGEHGKGFGVVAQEVKSLAEQSRQATNQVRAVLGDIQKATTVAVMATEEGGKAVEAGTRQTEIARESIQNLASSVAEAAQAAAQIAASTQQQFAGVDQVAGAMESIKQASTQNVASAKQLENAAINLNELGQRMKQLVERYKV